MSYRIERAKGAGPIDTDLFLENLFYQHSQAICRYLVRMTGDPALAQELTQETFLRAYCALEEGARWDNPRAWLYRVASRLAINHHHRRKLLQWLPLRSTDPEAAPSVEDAVTERLAVQEALAALSPKYRAPLVLYLDVGYSVAEIATILGLSHSAVKVRLHRARKQFRQAYLAQSGVPTSPEPARGTKACVRVRAEEE